MENKKDKIPVSIATIGCVCGEAGTRLIDDIKATTVNMDIIADCKKTMENLSKDKNK